MCVHNKVKYIQNSISTINSLLTQTTSRASQKEIVHTSAKVIMWWVFMEYLTVTILIYFIRFFLFSFDHFWKTVANKFD